MEKKLNWNEIYSRALDMLKNFDMSAKNPFEID